MNSLNRRRFFEQTATSAVGACLINSLSVGADEGLLSLVDPLLRAPATLPDAQNGLLTLDAALRLIAEVPEGDFETDDCFSTKRPDAQRDRSVADWLDNNAGILETLENVIKRGKLQFPTGSWDDERLNDLSKYRRLSRYLQLCAQRHLAKGRVREAAELCLKANQIFRLLEGAGGVYVEFLVTYACQGACFSLIRRIATSSATDAKTMRWMLASLPNISEPLAGIRAAIRAEYSCYLLPLLIKVDRSDTAGKVRNILEWSDGLEIFVPREKYESRCDKIVRLLDNHPKPFDLADTVKRSNALYVGFLRDLDRPWSTCKTQPTHKVADGLIAWPKELSMILLDPVDPDQVSELELAGAREKLKCVANALGRKILEAIQLDSKSMQQIALTNQASYDGTRITLAIAIFARENGRLPDSLDALRQAKILDRLPVDPYSSEGFQYSPDLRALWSVGWSGKGAPTQPVVGEEDFDPHIWRLDGLPG